MEAALASKLSSLTDVEGASSSLISNGSQLTRIDGDGGIAVALTLSASLDDPTDNQVRVSGQAILDQIATKQDIVTDGPLAINHVSGLQAALDSAGGNDTSHLLPNTGPAQFSGDLHVTNILSTATL